MQRIPTWIGIHPWRFGTGALLTSIALIALEASVGGIGKSFLLVPYPTLNPVTWWAPVALLFRALPYLATAVFAVPLAALTLLVLARTRRVRGVGA